MIVLSHEGSTIDSLLLYDVGVHDGATRLRETTTRIFRLAHDTGII